MSSSTMVRRGKPPGATISRLEGGTMIVENQPGNHVSSSSAAAALELKPVVVKAHVKRNFCGTGPFDKHWFNVDCCGIICALLTYGLHAYGVYCVCFVLIPPWMSYEYHYDDPMMLSSSNNNIMATTTEADHATASIPHHTIRYLTTTGRLTTTIFVMAAFMAVAAHFKAMTTDPGAVPPDARPLPEPVESLLQNDEPSSSETDGVGGEALSESQLISSATPSKTRRLCRRCKAFKPERAHHCSVCGRCIIKMDHHCPW